MSQKTYMYDTQWTALINAINGGDTSAIATALGQIKTSINSITTALGSLSTDVTQDSTQWNNLINAISSGGGGGGGTIDIDATQWSDLLTEIAKGDMTATATALNNIYTRLNSIGFNSTQWTNLVNAITNQSLTVDLSNITSSVVRNLSNVSGATLTDAINFLKSDLTNSRINTRIPGITAVKYGNIATLNIVTRVTAEASGWLLLGTLPDSLKPAIDYYTVGIDNSISTFATSHYTNVRLLANGQLSIYMFSDKLALQTATSFTYITNDN